MQKKYQFTYNSQEARMPGSSRGSSSGRGGLTGIETGTACCLTEHGTPCGAVFPSFSGFFFSVFFAARTLQFEILRTVTHQGSQSRRLHAVATLKMPDETLLSDFVIWLLAAFTARRSLGLGTWPAVEQVIILQTLLATCPERT